MLIIRLYFFLDHGLIEYVVVDSGYVVWIARVSMMYEVVDSVNEESRRFACVKCQMEIKLQR